MQFLYKFIWLLLTPFVPLIWQRREQIGKEDAARRNERFGNPSLPRPSGKLVWLHAASMGESLSLLSQIDEMRRHYPSWRYLVTTGTVTSARLMAQRLPAEAIHQYVPFDQPQWVRRFLDHWRPDGVLWVESEIWPNLIDGIRTRGIPAVLLNGRMSEKSARHWRMTRSWARRLIGTFTLIAAQTPADASRFRSLTTNTVAELGNLKFVSKALPVDDAKLAELQKQIGDRPVWLIASTHAPEEDIAARTHATLKTEFPNLLTIIALRHPVRGDDVAAQLAGYGAVTRRSLNQAPADIYICDTMGELGTLYSAVKPVVIGGSYTVGGHNPIEPAQLGCAVICGPLMYNFTAIVAAFDRGDALIHVEDEETLAPAVARLLRDPDFCAEQGTRAQEICWGEAESLPRLWAALEPWREAITNGVHYKAAA